MSTAASAVAPVELVQRSPMWHNVAVRLADEGVPVRAIVRSLMLPYDEVHTALVRARERGMILSVPHDDWPAGTRRDSRQPDIAPLEIEDEHMIMLAVRTFGFTPTMAKIFAALLRRPSMTKIRLHTVTQRDDGAVYPDKGKEPTQLRIVDVYICKMRKKYLPPSIQIITMWGSGYYIPVAGKEVAFKMMGITHDTFTIPADAPSDTGVNHAKAR